MPSVERHQGFLWAQIVTFSQARQFPLVRHAAFGGTVENVRGSFPAQPTRSQPGLRRTERQDTRSRPSRLLVQLRIKRKAIGFQTLASVTPITPGQGLAFAFLGIDPAQAERLTPWINEIARSC